MDDGPRPIGRFGDREPPWKSLGVGLVLMGLALTSPWLLSLGAIVLVVGASSKRWAAWSLVRLRATRSLSSARVFAGERLQLRIELINDKALPLAWVRLVDSVPERLVFEDASLEPSERPLRQSLLHLSALGPYERVSWSHRVHCPRRGHYIFGPMELRSGDLFGLFENRRVDALPLRLVVFPAVRTLEALGFPAGDPFGGQRADRVLNRDPLRPIGVREYRPEDRLRDVHWKASSRQPSGELQVKVLEPVSRPACLLVLDISTQVGAWRGVDPVMQERLIAVAASIASDATGRGRPLGLVANGVVPGTGRPIRVPVASRPDTLAEVLGALAAVSAFSHGRADRLLAMEARRAPYGTTLVVVTAAVDESLAAELLRQRRAGKIVALVTLSPSQRMASLPGIEVHKLDPERIEYGGAWSGDGDEPPREAA